MATWKPRLNAILAENMAKDAGSISYALSTFSDPSTAPSSPSSAAGGGVAGPRVRFVVHRGFLNERRPKEPKEWSTNPAGEENTTETMMVTTDVRGPKATQISSQSKVVEFAWWFAGTMHQFRIRSEAWILPHPEHPLRASFPAERLAPPGLPNFDWESERLRIFRKMSPDLRASFVRPIPGTPLNSTNPPIDPSTFPETLPTDLDAATEEERRLVREALQNFSLIVMRPWEVDLCELGVKPNRRFQWRRARDAEDGRTWKEEEVVP